MSLVGEPFAKQLIREIAISQQIAVIDIAKGEREIDNLAFIVAYQMELEAEEPVHGAFASLCQPLECPVLQYALVAAYAKQRAAYETDAGSPAHRHSLDEDNHCDFLQLHKTIVRNHSWKQEAHLIANMLVVMLQAAEGRGSQRHGMLS